MGLFGKNKLTEKVGNPAALTAFYIQFPELEGAPTFQVEDSLTVGSEVGEALISSEDISPRHCTFYLNQDVLTVMDHNSTQGTFIGKKTIDPGKMIILQPNDKIKLGAVKAQIIVEAKQVPIVPDFKRMDVESEESVIERPLPAPKEEKKVEEKAPKKMDKKNKKNRLSNLGTGIFRAKLSSDVAFVSNSFVRAMGLIFDLSIAACITQFLQSQVEGKELLDLVWKEFLQLTDQGLKLIEVEGMLGTLATDVVSFVTDPRHQTITLSLLMLMAIRIIFTLLLGVSLGQLMAGIRGHGNVIVKRLMGVIREVIGFVTGPLLIFDVPALLSRPTLKEFLTFTRLTSIVPLYTGISIILSTVVLATLFTLMPLLSGPDIMQPLPLANDISKPLTKELLDADQYFSQHFGAGFKQGLAENLIPSYSFVKNQGKDTVFLELVLVTDKTKLRIRPFKDFEWDQLLATALDMNPLTKVRFEIIDQVIHAAGNINPNFKTGAEDYEKYSKAVVELTNLSFGLGMSSFVDYVQQYGPLLRTLAEYRNQFMNLVPEDSRLSLITTGADAKIFVFETNKPEKFYLIPMTYPKGMVYQIETNQLSAEQMTTMLQKLYFMPPTLLKPKATQGAVVFVDSIYQGLRGEGPSVPLQQNYEWLYQRLKQLMEEKNEEQIKVWTNSLTRLLQIMESTNLHNDKKKTQWNKFYQNLSDVLKALKDNDLKFFGIKTRIG